MWPPRFFLPSVFASSVPCCPAVFSSFFTTLQGNLLQFLDFSIYVLSLTHHALLSKRIKSFPCFLCYEKRSRGAVLDGENLGPSLPKNNSHAACFLPVFHVLMFLQRKGLGSMECSSLHLPCVFLKVNVKLVFIPIFV